MSLFETGSGAHLSEDRRYRYALWRTWDPTRGGDWGYGGITMANLYAYRATDPRELLDAEDPVGADNDVELRALAESADLVVAAWGATRHPDANRPAHVLAFLGEVHCLGRTKDGSPRHPLYVRAVQRPELFSFVHCMRE